MTFRLLTDADRKAGFFIKYNFSGFLRGDAKTRAEVAKIWVNMGVPVNEQLAYEDRNPVEGGDIGFIQLNQMPIKDGGKVQDEEPAAQRSTEKRTIEHRSFENIVKARDRITKRYTPLIHGGIEKVLNRETLALTREIKKQLQDRGKSEFSEWLDEFYATMPDQIDKNLRSILESYAESMQEVDAGEVGLNEADFEDISVDTRDYLTGYARQYVDSSRGQIIQQLKTDDGLNAVQARVDEWH
jgi:hypothetical protein